MTTTIDYFHAAAAASEALARFCAGLDAKAAEATSHDERERLAADRAQLVAAARMVEGRMDDGGTFNAALWEPAALRQYVERELTI